jgi:hypothetical protein
VIERTSLLARLVAVSTIPALPELVYLETVEGRGRRPVNFDIILKPFDVTSLTGRRRPDFAAPRRRSRRALTDHADFDGRFIGHDNTLLACYWPVNRLGLGGDDQYCYVAGSGRLMTTKASANAPIEPGLTVLQRRARWRQTGNRAPAGYGLGFAAHRAPIPQATRRIRCAACWDTHHRHCLHLSDPRPRCSTNQRKSCAVYTESLSANSEHPRFRVLLTAMIVPGGKRLVA